MATASKQYKAIGEDLWKGRTEKIVCLIRLDIRELDPDLLGTQNAELFALTYGALVVQLIQDYEDYAEVNKQLEKMGYNIGTRLIEDFLARSSLGRCADFREVGEVVAKVRVPLFDVDTARTFMPAFPLFTSLRRPIRCGRQVGFKSFLNVSPNVTHGAQPLASSPNRASMPPQTNAPGSSFTLTFDENPLAEFVELPEEALDGGLWFSNVFCGVLRGALEMVRARSLTWLLCTLISPRVLRSRCKSPRCSYRTCYGATKRPKYVSPL